MWTDLPGCVVVTGLYVPSRRAVWNDRWEMTYVGPSQVLIKPLKGGGRGVILKSQYGYEIEDVKFMGTLTGIVVVLLWIDCFRRPVICYPAFPTELKC